MQNALPVIRMICGERKRVWVYFLSSSFYEMMHKGNCLQRWYTGRLRRGRYNRCFMCLQIPTARMRHPNYRVLPSPSWISLWESPSSKENCLTQGDSYSPGTTRIQCLVMCIYKSKTPYVGSGQLKRPIPALELPTGSAEDSVAIASQ